MKDQVYIEDPQASELTIDGVPCRKLGELKNGEEKTFEIEENQQRIFVVVDKLQGLLLRHGNCPGGAGECGAVR